LSECVCENTRKVSAQAALPAYGTILRKSAIIENDLAQAKDGAAGSIPTLSSRAVRSIGNVVKTVMPIPAVAPLGAVGRKPAV
jgi:hypothetical protein